MRSRSVLFVVALSLVSCSGNDPDPLGSATIGPAGGTLSLSDGRLSLTVPAGALTSDVNFRVDAGQISKVPGFVDVGPAYLFSPSATTFAAPAQIVIPFDPARVPSIVDTAELRVGLRSSTGQVTALLPTQIDDVLGRASFETLQLGTFWLAAPDVVAPADLFPLGDGDVYRFDSGLTLTIARTSAEPNFAPFEVAKLTFTRPGRVEGLYLDDRGGGLSKLGTWAAASYQDRNDSPVLLLTDRDLIGNVRVEVGTYIGFVPFGSPIGRYSGLEQVTTEVVARETVSTPAGTFDTVHVRISTMWTETPGGQGSNMLELWLAPGVGPVQLRFDDGLRERLRDASVGGAPIPPS